MKVGGLVGFHEPSACGEAHQRIAICFGLVYNPRFNPRNRVPNQNAQQNQICEPRGDEERSDMWRFSSQNFLLCLFVQGVTNLHHGPNVYFGSFPTLPDQHVVELLSGRDGCSNSDESLARGMEGAILRRKVHRPAGSAFLNEVGHLIRRVQHSTSEEGLEPELGPEARALQSAGHLAV